MALAKSLGNGEIESKLNKCLPSSLLKTAFGNSKNSSLFCFARESKFLSRDVKDLFVMTLVWKWNFNVCFSVPALAACLEGFAYLKQHHCTDCSAVSHWTMSVNENILGPVPNCNWSICQHQHYPTSIFFM